MMQLNQATDYAFRVMLHLAGLPEASVVSTRVLAVEQVIPLRFLLKLMRSLIAAGLVKSYRGTEGGFRLARAAAQISLWDIIVAMEGPVAIHRCLAEREACHKNCTEECPVHATLGKLQEEFVKGLQAATLTSLLDQRQTGTA
jgi:Rrf2 family protein